ncbi:hypothetical protein T11_17957 [Trichinella zimbabwensis]|uniref:Uncharacterized protein n=1 Tax=Trichinella zimbabwensis TaxID=268475 RepID=A0A0V1GYM8_9BILA|nr:hypothetical protein T11_17957 [Trichinella zimbabwensis]
MTLIIFDSGKKVDLKVEEISIWMRIDMESVIYWQNYYHNLVRLGEIALDMVNNEIADNMKQTLNIRYVWCPVGSHFVRLDYEYLE